MSERSERTIDAVFAHWCVVGTVGKTSADERTTHR
jgi:hypothetical protein